MGMLANRLRRMYRHLRKWARRTGVTCFRIYEKDIPDQPLIVDWYDGNVVAYALYRKKDETPEARDAWLEEVRAEIREGLEISDEAVFLKERRRQSPEDQYRRLAESRREQVVEEGGHRFLVNLSDYLDTGLFLDHRTTRKLVEEQAAGRRMLNLFCYTGSFTVYAIAGGAKATTSVDLSNTYVEWTRRNLELNGISPDAHEVIRADVLQWLPTAIRERRRYGIIVCDPPTFSNSKKMRDQFDVQVHHPLLINSCLQLLEPDGVIYFSNNFRRFKLEPDLLDPCDVEEITHLTVPEDFKDRQPHRCWRIRRPATQ